MLVLFLSSCSRLGLRRRWRWWTLAGVGLATMLAGGCGGSNPDPDLLVLPPSSAEALAPSAAVSTTVATPAPEPTGPAPLAPIDPAPITADLVPAPPAVEIPVILKPELDPTPTTEPEPRPDPAPEPVSLVEVGAVPEPAEAVVTDTPADHGHEHPEPNPAPEPGPAPEPLPPASSLPPPVGELILLAENTEETFIDGSGWVEARYQPIEVEIGAHLSMPGGDGSTIVTRMVDLEHNGLWDIYRCDVHEAYGGPPGTGWEFVGYAYRDQDGRFRLVVGSSRPVGPCGP